MAAGTFDGTTIAQDGYRERIGSVGDRTFLGSMPGVKGAFAQTGPAGTRILQATGFKVATGASIAAALKALHLSIHTLQNKIGTSGDFVSNSGAVYGECILRSYQQIGAFEVSAPPSVDDHTARCRVVAVMEQMDPEDVT